MRCVGVACAFGVVAAILLGGAAERARAQTTPLDVQLADAAPSDQLSGGRPEQLLLFAGFDIWRYGRAAYSGLQWSAQGLDNDGFIARLFISEGRERYMLPTQTFNTDIFRASLLPGWRFKRGDIEVKMFAGLDLDTRHLAPDFSSAPLRGTRLGARFASEVWWEPTPLIMVAASAYVTTIGNGAGGRVAAGWRVIDQFWIGPELSSSTDVYSTQTRFGGHLTGLRTAALEWSAAAGYLTDSYDRNGAYARIGVLLRQ